MEDKGLEEGLDWLGCVALSYGGGPVVPFVPTRRDALELVLRALKLTEDDVFYDLGCGDGRVVVEAAKRFPVKKAVCVEARRELVEEAKRAAAKEGVLGRVAIIRGDFYDVPLKDATAVYMYLLTSVNESLKPKLHKELRPGARVVTLDFQIPGWRPVEVLGDRSGWQSTVYVYVIGKSDV